MLLSIDNISVNNSLVSGFPYITGIPLIDIEFPPKSSISKPNLLNKSILSKINCFSLIERSITTGTARL